MIVRQPSIAARIPRRRAPAGDLRPRQFRCYCVNCAYFIYKFAQEIVLCRAPDAPRTERVTVVGNINEAGDVFAEDYLMPPVREGDVVAILNAGGYRQAMSSTHCLRPTGQALFFRRTHPS
jgi:diaminopimelate decarboxylase